MGNGRRPAGARATAGANDLTAVAGRPYGANVNVPYRQVKRWEPPPPPPPRGKKSKPSPWLAPFRWWARHPWVVVWVAVFLSPFAVLVLRVADESWSPRLVTPLQWLFIGFFCVALLLGLLVTSPRSALRAGGGLVFSVLGLVLLVAPLTHVTLGRGGCPPRAGRDLGAAPAAAVLEAWKSGAPGAAAWRGGEADASWQERARGITLMDYRLVDSGCWERVAPISASSTWHEFRVTVKEGDRAPLSKTVLVHTEKEGTRFKVAAVDGPLP